MIMKTQEESRSVALRNFERKQVLLESSSKAPSSPRSSRSKLSDNWCLVTSLWSRIQTHVILLPDKCLLTWNVTNMLKGII